jgi:tRNA pseudouridine55 synthase
MSAESAEDYVLLVDKPVGPTSHDVVAIARRLLSTRRVGHTGTLDPFASGLLLLCVNRATRVVEFLTGLHKVYQGSARLDAFTDTDDHTGAVLQRFDSWQSLDQAQIESSMRTLTGSIKQSPPAYSAKKVGGERLHRLARRGEMVELEPIEVEVQRFDLTGMNLPTIEFEAEVSSGTYVRAMARDLGRALGTGGHLSALRRTRIGRFDVNAALTVEQLDHSEGVVGARLTMLEALAHMPRVDVDRAAAARLRRGQWISASDEPGSEPIVVASDGELVALARRRADLLMPFKVWTPDV